MTTLPSRSFLVLLSTQRLPFFGHNKDSPFRTLTVPLPPQLQGSTLTSAPPPGPLLTRAVLILTLKLQQTQASSHPVAIFATLTLQIQTGPSYRFSGFRTTSVLQFLFSFSSHRHFHPLRPGVRHSQYPQILPWFLVTFHRSLAIPDHGKFSLSFTHWQMNLSLK